MPDVFWIGFGVLVFGFLTGIVASAASRDTSVLAGAAIGAYLGLMFGFPLLAIGVSTS